MSSKAASKSVYGRCALLSVAQNWLAEFDKWVPAPEAVPQNLVDSGQVRPRSYRVYLLNDIYRSTPARAELICKYNSNVSSEPFGSSSFL